MGTSLTSLRYLASMEAALYEGAQPDASGTQRSAGLYISVQWPGPKVELGSATYESGTAEETLGSAWTGLNTGYDKPA